MTGLLVTIVLFPLAGAILGRRPFAELFLLGTGVVGSAMFLGGLVGVPFPVTIAIVALAGAVGLFFPLWGRPSGRPGGLKPAPTVVLTIIPLIILAAAAAIVPLNDYDGRAFWLLKAKGLAHDGVIDGPYFRGETVFAPKNSYPLLVPLDAAAVMVISRDLDDQHVRWLYLGFFAALLFHARRRLARHVSPEVAAWCVAVLAWTPQFLFAAEGSALSAYCDIPMAAFVACAFFEILDGESPLRFGLWLAFLVLTKNEGLPFALVLLAVGAFTFRRRVTAALPPVFIVIVALAEWRHRVAATDEEDYVAHLPRLVHNLDRVGPALTRFLAHALDVRVWGLFWIAGLLALIFVAARGEWRPLAVVVAMGGVYLLAFVVTTWPPADLIHASANRLWMHFVGPGLFAIARMSSPVRAAGE